MEATSSILLSHPSSLPPPFHLLPSSSLHLSLPSSTLSLHPPKTLLHVPISLSTRRPKLPLCAAAAEILSQPPNSLDSHSNLARRKLYVVNLPWTSPSTSIRDMFAEFGPVTHIEMIKDNRGRFKGYAFVTMDSPETAQTAIDKLNQSEVSGRVIGVEYAKAFKPQTPSDAAANLAIDTPYKLYVSNLQWKVRSTHLREMFSPEFSVVSARVVFDGATGRSAGYGFVSFASKEDAAAAVASFNGRELMGRPIILKFKDEVASDAPTNDGSSSTDV